MGSKADVDDTVRKVWFAGVHAGQPFASIRFVASHAPLFPDVGGGSVENSTPHALACVPLRWMIREIFHCNTGIIFDASMLQQIGLSLRYTPASGIMLEDIPERLGAHEVHKLKDFHQDSEDEQVNGWISWAWCLLSVLAAPVLGLLRAAGVTRRLTGKNRILNSARAKRGRHLLPSRPHPSHARTVHGGARNSGDEMEDEDSYSPHALDPAHAAERDPLYEAREELKLGLGARLSSQLCPNSSLPPSDTIMPLPPQRLVCSVLSLRLSFSCRFAYEHSKL